MRMNQPTEQTHYIACNLCEAICGLEIRVADGKITSIRGDDNDPVSKGHICPKGVALQDIHNDPDRLLTPRKRTAKGWQEISWRQAFNEVTLELKRVSRTHGSQAIATYLGNPTVHNLQAMLYGPMFFRTLRTSNRFSATSVDQLPEQLVSLLMFGHSLLIPLPDIDRTKFHIIFGANPVVSNGSLMTAPGITRRLKSIGKQGGQLVVIDPRRTETAAIADRHLFIRPGSDVYMLLAMLQVVFEEGLHDPGTVKDFCRGMDVIETAVAPFTPEDMQGITGVGAGDVRSLVRDFCRAECACCYGRIGVSTQKYGSLTQWLINVFNIVTGNLDKPGGTMFSQPAIDILSPVPRGKKGFADRFTRVRQLPNFNGEFPVAALAEEILTPGDGQIRALVCHAGNPALSTPNGRQLETALQTLDFMVSIDFYLNETSRYANIILPPTSALERSHYDLVFQALAIRNGAKLSQAVFKPGPKQRSDLQIFTELAWRMQGDSLFGRGSGWLKKTALQLLGSDWILGRMLKRSSYHQSHRLDLENLKRNPHGIDLGPLQPCLPDRLFTADKTIELAPQDLLDQLENLKTEQLAANSHASGNGRLLLIGRRDPRSNNSWLHNSHRMVKGKPRCVAIIHPTDASARELREGDTARVTSRVGSIDIPVRISDEMMPGVISIPHGWGHDAAGIELAVARQNAGVNTNVLTDEKFLDSLSGNAALNGVEVSVTKASLASR
jgi:anaerobic selenocysteine-containing dehydrogenase